MTTTINTKRGRPTLTPIITRLRYQLAPLHPLPEGLPHPSFPPTLLHYHLLTEDQLDSIAIYYHQNMRAISPTIWTYGYPTNMNWDSEFLAHLAAERGMETRVRAKRRKVGRFIGLRGCETPTEERDERERWLARRDNMALKTEDAAFWGRRGYRQW